MAQSTTNLGKIHVFPSETLYNQFKGIIADNDLALLKDDGAYIVAALLGQNGYVKFSNGLILQWGKWSYTGKKVSTVTLPISMSTLYAVAITKDRVNGGTASYTMLLDSFNGISIAVYGDTPNTSNLYVFVIGKA